MNEQEFIKYLLQNANFIKKHNKDEIIFNENDLCEYVCIVKNGEILVSSYSYKGNEIIFKKIKPMSMFGHLLIFATNNVYRGIIISKTNSEIAYINKNCFYNLIIKEPFLSQYLAILSDDILISKEKTRVLSFNSTSDRLLYLLSIHQSLKFESISSLAKDLSITRESLSRTLKSLEKQEIIKIKNKTIYLK